jgi:Lrp/AsnC family leucine-responsive transcriptional regulator
VSSERKPVRSLQLDDLDLAILAALEENARLSVSELARRLGAPGSTIRDRISRLEEEGVILGYTTRIDAAKLGLGIKAILQVARDERFSLEDFHRETAELPAVTTVQLVTGETDELITVHAGDVEHLKEIIYNVIGALPGVTRSNTAIVLEEARLPLTRSVQREA